MRARRTTTGRRRDRRRVPQYSRGPAIAGLGHDLIAGKRPSCPICGLALMPLLELVTECPKCGDLTGRPGA